MSGSAIVFQCGTCRALTAVSRAVIAEDRASAGLACAVCGATTWLAANVQHRAVGFLDAASPQASSSAAIPGTAPGLRSPSNLLTALTVSSLAPPDGVDDEDTWTTAAETAAEHEPTATPSLPEAPATTTSTSASLASSLAAPPTTAAAAVAPVSSTIATPAAWTPDEVATPPSDGDALAPRIAGGTGLPHGAREQVLARWAQLDDHTPARAPLIARLERLATERWNDEAEHKAFLRAASVAGELAFIGARYRAVLDVIREEPRARAAQRDLLSLALATMKGAPDLSTPTPGQRSGVYIAVVVVAALLLLASAGYFVSVLATTLEQVNAL